MREREREMPAVVCLAMRLQADCHAGEYNPAGRPVTATTSFSHKNRVTAKTGRPLCLKILSLLC